MFFREGKMTPVFIFKTKEKFEVIDCDQLQHGWTKPEGWKHLHTLDAGTFIGFLLNLPEKECKNEIRLLKKNDKL